MQIMRPIYRDENATELNKLLHEYMAKLEQTCIGFDEALMDITLIESERREKEFDELIQNPEEFHRVIDLIDKRNMCEELLDELKDIVYIDYEKVEISTEISSVLNSETTPRFRKRSDSADWLGDNVKPYILNTETPRRNEIGEMLNVSPQTITNRIKQVYGNEIDWKTYVYKVKNGKW